MFTEENDLSVWNLDNVSVEAVSTSIPEPASVLLLTAAVICLGVVRRRHKS